MRVPPREWLVAAALGAIALPQSGATRGVAGPPPAPPVLWRVDEEGRGRPAHDARTAYFLSTHHTVVAVESATGSVRWRQPTGEPGESTQGSSLAIDGSVVVAGDYNLTAFDRQTGARRWQFVPTLGYAPGLYLGEAAGGLVLTGSPAGRLYAVEAGSGRAVWTATVVAGRATTVFPPVLDGGSVAAGYTVFDSPHTGGAVLIEAASGREVWRAAFKRAADQRLGTGSAGGPIIADRVVVASSGDGTVYGFDRHRGHVVWTLPPIDTIPAIVRGPQPLPPTASAPDYRPLVRAGGTLVVGSLRGDVVAYDLETRRERWRYLDSSNGSVAFGMAIDGDSVYVPFVSGRHVALALSTGMERWRTARAAEGFRWPAASDGGRIFLAGEKGGLIAIRQ